MSLNHIARTRSLSPRHPLSGGLVRVPRLAPRPCNQVAQTSGLLFMSTPAANTPWGGQYGCSSTMSKANGTYRTATDALISAEQIILHCRRMKSENQRRPLKAIRVKDGHGSAKQHGQKIRHRSRLVNRHLNRFSTAKLKGLTGFTPPGVWASSSGRACRE